jgi:hypothetical protein
VHDETLSVAAMRVNDPDRSASESAAEIQPKVHPALMGLREFPSTMFDRPTYNDSHEYKTALRCIHRSVHFRFPI